MRRRDARGFRSSKDLKPRNACRPTTLARRQISTKSRKDSRGNTICLTFDWSGQRIYRTDVSQRSKLLRRPTFATFALLSTMAETRDSWPGLDNHVIELKLGLWLSFMMQNARVSTSAFRIWTHLSQVKLAISFSSHVENDHSAAVNLDPLRSKDSLGATIYCNPTEA